MFRGFGEEDPLFFGVLVFSVGGSQGRREVVVPGRGQWRSHVAIGGSFAGTVLVSEEIRQLLVHIISGLVDGVCHIRSWSFISKHSCGTQAGGKQILILHFNIHFCIISL